MNKYEVNMRQEKIPSVHKRASYYGEAPAEFNVTYTPVKSGIFNIYVMGDIEESSQFINAIEVMAAATEMDTVNIHLSSNGGSLDAADTFLASMNRCEAKVVAYVSGGCHSAASIILLNADEFSLSENANFLLHCGSSGSGGKFSDFKSQSKHTIEYMERVLRKTYKHFLTNEELDALIEGKDFWLNAEEFAERYEIRNQALMEEFETAQEQAEAATQAAIENASKPARAKKASAK